MKKHLTGVLAIGVLASGLAATPAGSTAAIAAPPSATAADDAPEDPRVVPDVNAGPLTRLVPYGTATGVNFVVRVGFQPATNRAVRLCTAPATGDFACVTTTTSSTGVVAARTPNVTAPIRMNLVVPEGEWNQGVTSGTVLLTPQATVTVARSGGTMTVRLTGLANQHLVVKRLARGAWVVDRVQRVSTASTTVTGLAHGARYHVLISDTPTIKGNVSTAV
jgi:hypothetical protein